MSWAIRADHVCKTYKQYGGRKALLRELLFRRPMHRRLEALRDVSFEIPAGEAFGLIGDNGAGKSTLLKVLCGTTFPSAGRLEVQGSVSALLELGAGFHPEFTGRSNIYFSGALMGFSEEEIRAREPEIIAFSELQDFVDQPVKTFSSGMHVRLGFAIATGFDPAVLVIDEALAVGDQGFQKKCTDRIMEFQEKGKTIVFCSHNLYQVRKLCHRALWLEHGRAVALGPCADVVDRYTDNLRAAQASVGSTAAPADPIFGSLCRLEHWRLVDAQGHPRDSFETGETLRLEIWTRFRADFEGTPGVGVAVLRNDGVNIYTTSSTIDGTDLVEVSPGLHYVCFELPSIALMAGRYAFTVMATDQFNMQVYDAAEQVGGFTIRHPGPDFGVTHLHHSWSREDARVPPAPGA